MPTLHEILKKSLSAHAMHAEITKHLQELSPENLKKQNNAVDIYGVSPFVYALILDTLYTTKKVKSTLADLLLKTLGEEAIHTSLTQKDRDVLNALGSELDDFENVTVVATIAKEGLTKVLPMLYRPLEILLDLFSAARRIAKAKFDSSRSHASQLSEQEENSEFYHLCTRLSYKMVHIFELLDPTPMTVFKSAVPKEVTYCPRLSTTSSLTEKRSSQQIQMDEKFSWREDLVVPKGSAVLQQINGDITTPGVLTDLSRYFALGYNGRVCGLTLVAQKRIKRKTFLAYTGAPLTQMVANEYILSNENLFASNEICVTQNAKTKGGMTRWIEHRFTQAEAQDYKFLLSFLKPTLALANATIETVYQAGIPFPGLQFTDDLEPGQRPAFSYGSSFFLEQGLIPFPFDKKERMIPAYFYDYPIRLILQQEKDLPQYKIISSSMKTKGCIEVTLPARDLLGDIKDKDPITFEDLPEDVFLDWKDMKAYFEQIGYLPSCPTIKNHKDLEAEFRAAAYEGDFDKVYYLLEWHPSPPIKDIDCVAAPTKDNPNPSGNSALHNAVRQGQFYVTLYLLIQGANRYLKNREGKTPICLSKEYPEVSKLMKEPYFSEICKLRDSLKIKTHGPAEEKESVVEETEVEAETNLKL